MNFIIQDCVHEENTITVIFYVAHVQAYSYSEWHQIL
jgi:hypothetical protein